MNTNQKSADNSPDFSLYHVNEGQAGVTLAAALKDIFQLQSSTHVSWTQVKRSIVGRHIDVNGNLCLDESRRLRNGDVIRVWLNSRPKAIDLADIQVAYFDPHLIVIEKPAGVTSVRHVADRKLSEKRRQLQPTLDELLPRLLARLQQIPWPRSRTKKPGRGPKPGSQGVPPELAVYPVHRLDRDTSGLMVFARTRTTEQKLIAMFRRHDVIREYVGVCHGQIQPQTIRSMLVRDRGDGLRGSLPAQATPEQRKSAQQAVTHIVGAKPIAQGQYSLFRCKLETGRTHQIRIHFSEAGHRLCGEPLYGVDSQGVRQTDESGAPRQALHSDRLSLVHPITGEPLKFQIAWPRDLAAWVRGLS